MLKPQNYLLILALVCLSFVYFKTFIEADVTLISQVKGKILLQVENHGEAWYVSPLTDQRYYLGRPNDAFDLMKTLGIGIKNDDLKKIPIDESSFIGPDSDYDGLSDLFEDAIGTDKNNIDTDNDGHSDKIEISGNYNPNGEGKIVIDEKFGEKLVGMIMIQAEQNGEAWYINPANNKRYFLGRPSDAFTVMRKTGLGISNANLTKIAIYSSEQNNNQTSNQNIVKNGKKLYTDANKKFSFEYPESWIFNKVSGTENNVLLRNYQKDLMKEKKAEIRISFIKVDSAIDLNRFKLASKKGAEKEKSQLDTINNLNTLKEVFDYKKIDSRDTTTYIQLSDKTLLKVTIFSAGNHEIHDAILDDILRSVKKID